MRINPATYGDGITGMVVAGFHVRAEAGQPLGQVCGRSRQVAHASAGDVLFVQVVLFRKVLLSSVRVS